MQNSLRHKIIINFQTDMQKQSTSGFKFYPGKHHSPFTALNLGNQTFSDSNYFPNSLKQGEEGFGKEKVGGKTKLIQKGREKEREQVKRYDRGGNCVASNTSKLFIKILNKRLSRFPVIQKYLNNYEIYSQKQNILLIPLCLYSFLKQYETSDHNRFHSELEIAQTRVMNSLQRETLNTRQIYLDIITELKDHIECSLENSRGKFKDCSDSKKQFHQKNISIYNKISQIIKKVQQLANGLTATDDKLSGSTTREKPPMFTVVGGAQRQPSSSSSPSISEDIKIEQEQLNYSNMQSQVESIKKQQQSNQMKDQGVYNLQSLQSPLQSLYQRKQRQYQKAMDKVYSVIMNEKPLRELFGIYRLDVKDILIQSVNYCYRRNINSRVKKNQKIIKEIYQKLETVLINAMEINQKNEDKLVHNLRGWEFIIAFLTLQVAGDKKTQIYDEFKQNIKRKTKYFNLIQTSPPTDPKQQFDSYYYNYSLRILQQHYEAESKRKNQAERLNIKDMRLKIKEWMIGYFYHNKLNSMCLQGNKQLIPKTSQQITNNKLLNKPQYEHLMTVNMHNPSSSPSSSGINIQRKMSQIKHEEETEKVPTGSTEEARHMASFGNKEERALTQLMAEFQSLSKENYENFY